FFNRGRLPEVESVDQTNLHAGDLSLEGPPPGTAHAAGDGHDVGEDAAEAEDGRVGRMVWMEQRSPVPVGHRVLVEVRQQVRDRGNVAVPGSFGIEPVLPVLHDLVSELRTDDVDAGARVGHREAGPPDEVLQLSRSVAPKV